MDLKKTLQKLNSNKKVERDNKIDSLQKEGNGYWFGVFRNRLANLLKNRLEIFEFMKLNSKPGQEFPFRDRSGKEMFIKIGVTIGFKANPGDTDYTSKSSSLTLMVNHPEAEKAFNTKELSNMPSADVFDQFYVNDIAYETPLIGLLAAYKSLAEKNHEKKKKSWDERTGEEKGQIKAANKAWSAKTVSDPESELNRVLAEITELEEEGKREKEL